MRLCHLVNSVPCVLPYLAVQILGQPLFQGSLLLALPGALGLQGIKGLVADVMPAEDKEACVGSHPVRRAQTVGQGLPVTQKQFLHFYGIKGTAFKPFQKLAHLYGRRQKKAQHGARPDGLYGIVQVFPGSAHIKEEGVSLFHAEPFGHVADIDFDIVADAGPFKVAAGQLGKLLACVMADNAAGGAAEPGERKGQAA